MKSGSNSNLFYERLAPVYSLKVDWKTRSEKESRLFRYLLETLAPKSVLDIGCGDGGHADRYSTANVRYLGIDKSPTMVQTAKDTHKQFSKTSFSVGDVTELPKSTAGKFEQVIMLGNTIPHVTTLKELDASFAGISRSLVAGGYFVLQTVNPGTLARKSAHFLPPKLTQGVLFTPFYINRGKHWEFYMPIFHVNEAAISAGSVTSTILRFWSHKDLVTMAKKHSLVVYASFGSGQLDSYTPESSDNLILVFRKQANARTSRG